MASAKRQSRLTRRQFVAGSATALAAAGLMRHTLPVIGAAAPAPAPVRPSSGGVLRTTLGAEPTTLDPHRTVSLFDYDVKDAIFSPLISDDFLDGAKGALAESWESPDASTYIFKLRRGARFHDGSPVNGDAVKFTFERVATTSIGLYRSIPDQVSAVDVLDPQTVRVRLKAPNAAFLIDIADMAIVPPNFDPQRPIGAGPFQFVEWVRLRHVRTKKFPGFWREGRPYLDELLFMPTPDENQKVTLLETGQVEFTDTVPLPRVREIERSGKMNVLSIPPGVAASSYYLLTRSDRPPLDNLKVRQAMNFAIDRKGIMEVLFGKGTLKSNIIPPKNWAFNPQSVSFNDRDLPRAKKLLAESGHGNGFALQLKHFTSRAEFAPISQLVAANLAELNIKVDVLPLQIGIWLNQVLVERDFQIALSGIIPRHDPDIMLGEQYSVRRSSGKAIGWKHDLFERQIDQGRAVVNQEARKRVYLHAQLIAQWESAGFVLNERPILMGAAQSVQGFKPDVRQLVRFEDVWLKR